MAEVRAAPPNRSFRGHRTRPFGTNNSPRPVSEFPLDKAYPGRKPDPSENGPSWTCVVPLSWILTVHQGINSQPS